MKILKLLPIVLLLLLFGCSKSELTLPPTISEANLAGTISPPFIGGSTIQSMEGIYSLFDGSESLGQSFVCKVSKYRVSFFSNKGGIYIILKYGYRASDGSMQFSGFWRYSESPDQGTIQFEIRDGEGAAELLTGVASNIKLRGDFSGHQLTLQFDREFSNYAKANPIMIFAHHGVQTTADPPFAENSLKVVRYAEDYGVNGLELDVRMSKDNVPLLIHDPTINVRLTKKGPLFGGWDQYSFEFISRFVRLIDGQQVPSVEQALRVFVDSTSLKYFWMDIKGNEDIFKHLEPIVREAYRRADSLGRDVEIFAGLPGSTVIDELASQPTYKSNNPAYAYSDPLPTLAEETVDKAISTGSEYFGPRYTLGLLLPEVELAHTNGIKVISWTLNSHTLITNYLQNGKFDGFITDYPAYVVYEYYTMF